VNLKSIPSQFTRPSDNLLPKIVRKLVSSNTNLSLFSEFGVPFRMSMGC
jgi:hypothetical protein